MDVEEAKGIVRTALEDDDGDSFADMMTNPTPAQAEALRALEGNAEAIDEDLAYEVWLATDQWPAEGATWGDVSYILIAQLGRIQGEIQRGAQFLSRLREEDPRPGV